MDRNHPGNAHRDPRPTVICLHASGGSGGQWKALAELIRNDFDVLTPDLHGHGTGPMWDGAPMGIVAADAESIARLAADAPGDVHLVGHSYGGAIALRVATRHPANVASVAVYEPVPMRVLFDHHAVHRAAAEVALVAESIRRELARGNPDGAGSLFVDYWAGAGQWTRLSPERRAAFARRMPVINAHFVSLIGDVVRRNDYAGIEVPVLYLTGRETRASARAIAEVLTAALPDVESTTLSAMGHLGPITHAAIVARRFERFVRAQAGVRVADRRLVA